MNKSDLINELKKAYDLASQYEGGHSGEFLDAREFAAALKKSIEMFEAGNDDCVMDLWGWFAPTTEWDDFIGCEGMELGNSIFEKLDEYRKQQGIKL
jgi:hypothetical protein